MNGEGCSPLLRDLGSAAGGFCLPGAAEYGSVVEGDGVGGASLGDGCGTGGSAGA